MLPQYKNKVVQDLSWCISSPGLLTQSLAKLKPSIVSDSWCLDQHQQLHDWLSELDQNPQPPITWLTRKKPYPLGVYFELLIEFWLRHATNIRWIDSRIQIYRGQQTLGELDFLFEQADQLTHWEVAVKFYLQYLTDQGEVRWYGPNAKDRLDLKVSHLLNHQLTISRTPEACPLFKQYPTLPLDKILLKGYLFYSNDQAISPTAIDPSAKLISEHHLKGWWTYENQRTLPANHMECLWLRLTKPDWLSQVSQMTEPENIMDLDQLQHYLDQHFSASKQAVLIAQVQQCPQRGWLELSRGFVVAKIWPK